MSMKRLKGARKIKKKFQWYRCESGIAIFAWKVTLNYAYSPLNWNPTHKSYFRTGRVTPCSPR